MTPSTSEGMKGGRPRTAITATMGAREELCSGREKEGRRLGWVEEGVGGAYHGLESVGKMAGMRESTGGRR